MFYEVNINGQPLGRMERADIERRAAAWKSAGAQVEILDPVLHLNVSLAAFLARPPQTVPSPPPGLIDQFDSNIPQGHYEVRVNGQLIGTLSAPDILRRAHIWSNASVEISSPVTGALAFDAWRQRIAARFEPLLWPASGDARCYSIRIRGQRSPKRATRSEIEWHAANGILDPGVEIVDDQGASAPLSDFLNGNFPARQSAPTPSPGFASSSSPGQWPVYQAPKPVIQPFGPGPYYVRVGASTLGPLDRDDIERRAAHWPSGIVQVAESAAGPFVPLVDFLRMLRPAAVQVAAQVYVPYAAQYPGQPPAAIQAQGKPFHPGGHGFIGYCQSILNRAFPAGAARRNKILYFTAGAVALCVVVALFFAFVHKDAAAKMQAARDALQNGEFEAAAKQLDGIDLPEAKFDLACLYKNGLGVLQDSQKAVKLMTDAANSGAPLAQTMLGLWYANGDGVTTDPSQAVIWYQKAAPKDSNATVLLAMSYMTGTGVEESPAKAYEWFTVAEKQGNSYATEQKKEMSVLLDEQERDAAEHAAKADYAAFPGGGK
jgi:TPR repeat protein